MKDPIKKEQPQEEPWLVGKKMEVFLAIHSPEKNVDESIQDAKKVFDWMVTASSQANQGNH